jgi:hypothetical protein
MPVKSSHAAPEHTAEPAVGFDQTIDRNLVHRAALAEVLLTDVVRLDAERFTLGVQWPRAHTFYGTDAGGRHDPMLIAECIRQSGLLLSHIGFDVPHGTQFVFRDLDFHIESEAAMLVGAVPTNLEVIVTCTELRRRDEGLGGMRVNLELYRDGDLAAAGSGAVACVSPENYPAMRWRGGDSRTHLPAAAPPPSADPASVGRRSEDDVVLGVTGEEEPGWWSVRVLTDHAVLFDHPLDHIPGMLELEAFRQAAMASAGVPAEGPPPLLSELRIKCLRYGDLDRIAYCAAEPDEAGVQQLRMTQDGEDIAVGSIAFL